VVWLAINFFYWPFWLAQTDRRLLITLRNGLVLLAKSPGLALTLLVVCAALAAAGVLLTLPLAVALMAWLALLGTLAVDGALKAAAPQPIAPTAGVEIDVP